MARFSKSSMIIEIGPLGRCQIGYDKKKTPSKYLLHTTRLNLVYRDYYNTTF